MVNYAIHTIPGLGKLPRLLPVLSCQYLVQVLIYLGYFVINEQLKFHGQLS